MMGAPAKSTSQAAVLLTLVGLAAVALRGSLPGSDRTADRPHPLCNTAALVIVVALLAVSLTFVAVAVVARIRNPPTALNRAPVRMDWARGGAGRPGWRFWLIAAAASPARCCSFICSRTGISATSGTRRSPGPLRTVPRPMWPPPRRPDARTPGRPMPPHSGCCRRPRSCSWRWSRWPR